MSDFQKPGVLVEQDARAAAGALAEMHCTEEFYKYFPDGMMPVIAEPVLLPDEEKICFRVDVHRCPDDALLEIIDSFCKVQGVSFHEGLDAILDGRLAVGEDQIKRMLVSELPEEGETV